MNFRDTGVPAITPKSKLSNEYLTKCRNVCMKYGLDVPPKVVLELLDHIDALEAERPELVQQAIACTMCVPDLCTAPIGEIKQKAFGFWKWASENPDCPFSKEQKEKASE